jgi:hypothetical protein
VTALCRTKAPSLLGHLADTYAEATYSQCFQLRRVKQHVSHRKYSDTHEIQFTGLIQRQVEKSERDEEVINRGYGRFSLNNRLEGGF